MSRELTARLTKTLPLLANLETGQDCEDYAFAKADGFQAMTYCPEAFEALRCIPEVIEALRTRDEAARSATSEEVERSALWEAEAALRAIDGAHDLPAMAAARPLVEPALLKVRTALQAKDHSHALD